MTFLLWTSLISIILLAFAVLFPIPWTLMVEKENNYMVKKGVIKDATADKIARFEKGKGFKVLLILILLFSTICIWRLT